MKSKPTIIILITLVIILGISFVAIWPVASKVFSVWRDLEKTKISLKEVQDKHDALTELQKNPNLKPVSDIALKYIPKESLSGDLVIELTAIANNNQMKVEAISMESPKNSSTSASSADETATASPTPTPGTSSSPTASYSTVNFSMKLSGTFSSFLAFLNGTETSSRLITIDSLNLAQAKDTEAGPSFSADIKGMAYFKNKITITDTLESIKLSEKVVQQFLKLQTYGTPINLPQESGFGRANPFEGI